MTSSKVNRSPSVKSTGTLFVVVLVNPEFVSNRRRKEKKTEAINCKGEIAGKERKR